MIPQIPEINPVQLLYNPYNPITRYELAEILGVSDCTVKSWIERKRVVLHSNGQVQIVLL